MALRKSVRGSVSIHARRISRAISLALKMLRPESRKVSIHARRISRAISTARGRAAGCSAWFQSTPGELAGRFYQVDDSVLIDFPFQSTPGELAGRFPPGVDKDQDGHGFQSTPGELAGRFLSKCSTRPPWYRFQSTPGELAGRFAMKRRPHGQALEVSIHARRISRAIWPGPDVQPR